MGSQRVEQKQPATGCYIVWTHEEAGGGNKFSKQRTKARAGSFTVTQSEGPMHLWEEELTCEVGEKCADTGEVPPSSELPLQAPNLASRLDRKVPQWETTAT